jgi:hypothetical protein
MRSMVRIAPLRRQRREDVRRLTLDWFVETLA